MSFLLGLVTGVLGIIPALTQQQTNGYVLNPIIFYLAMHLYGMPLK